MKLKEIVAILDGEVLLPEVYLEMEVPCAFSSYRIIDILMCTKEPTLLLTGLTNNQVIRLCDMIDIVGIVFVRGKRPLQDIIDMARERNIPLICTNYTMYRSSGLLFNAGLRSCKI